jgi:hypothetical protein
LTVDAYFRMELCTPTWLNYNYGDGGVVDTLVVDAYSRVELCTPIFLVEASKKIVANHLKKSKLKWAHPLIKINTTRVAMWIIFGSGRNVYVIEEPS